MKDSKIDKLLVRISDGDNAAFEELYLATRRGVFSFLYTYFHNHHDTEDAMQSTYLKLKRGIHSYRHGTGGIRWILEIAKNHALDELRKRRPIIDIDTLPEESYDHSDGGILDLIERTLAEDEARIVMLHVLWQYKHREIAAVLGVPVGTVTSKYKRAIDKLKEKMKEADL